MSLESFGDPIAEAEDSAAEAEVDPRRGLNTVPRHGRGSQK